MEITLEKIELVKDRTGVSYKEAKEALVAADGSVVDAIINIEETIDEKGKNKFADGASNVIEKLKELIRKGNVARILVRKDDELILNLPLNVGIVGTVIAPVAMIAGFITAFGTKCVIEVVKNDGTIIDVSEMASDAAGYAAEKGSELVSEVKVRSAELYDAVREKSADAYEAVKDKAAEFRGCDHPGCACGEDEPECVSDPACGCEEAEDDVCSRCESEDCDDCENCDTVGIKE